IRIHIADGEAGTYNTVNVVYLDLPPSFYNGITLQPNPLGSLRKAGVDWFRGSADFPTGSSVLMRSMVLPHGDYRLTCTPLRVEPDMFVPHANAGGGQFAISTWESYYSPSDRSKRNAGGIATYST